MRILLAPDSFKGSLTSLEVCSALSEGIQKASPDIEIMQFPSSDGGEGFCDCMGNIFGGERICREVSYPLGDRGNAVFIYNSESKTAFIELASAAGLHLVPEKQRDIFSASTFGVGELISAAINNGAKKIIIGLGGSATNDCGIGLLSALGMKFFDKDGNVLQSIPASLDKVSSIDKTQMTDFSGIEIIAACDVKNPLCGPNGAARIFAKQKGATQEEIDKLDSYAFNFANVLGVDPDGEGYGAAGGVGMALIAVLGAKYVSGASLLVSSERFQKALKSADLVFTGEGNTDAQTLEGKLVSVVSSAAKMHGVPTIVLSGGLSEGSEGLYSIGVKELHCILEHDMELEYCIRNAYSLLVLKMQKIIHDVT